MQATTRCWPRTTPHFDVVLTEATVVEAAKLFEAGGRPEENPFKKRGRR